MKRFTRHWRVLPLAILMMVSLAQARALRERGVHNNDFKHLWAGVQVLAQGGSPYDPDLLLAAAAQHGLGPVNPYVYLPATGLMLRPLGWLSFSEAGALWFWLNFALAWACVLTGPWLLRVERPWLAACVGGLYLIGSLPFMRQMTAGQMNVILLASVLASLGLLVRGRARAAGTILGFAAAFKIAPAFLVALLAAMDRRKAFAAAVIAFASIMIIALFWVGWPIHREGLEVIGQMGYGSGTWEDFYRQPFNQSVNSLMHHLLTENPYSAPWIALGPATANGATIAVSLLLLAGLAGLLFLYHQGAYRREPWSDRESSLLLIGSLLMLLLPSLMWDHYAVQALGAMMWIAGSKRAWTGWGRPALLAIAFWALAYPWFHASETWSFGIGLLLMSIRLWGTLILLGLLVDDALRRLRFPNAQ